MDEQNSENQLEDEVTSISLESYSQSVNRVVSFWFSIISVISLLTSLYTAFIDGNEKRKALILVSVCIAFLGLYALLLFDYHRNKKSLSSQNNSPISPIRQNYDNHKIYTFSAGLAFFLTLPFSILLMLQAYTQIVGIIFNSIIIGSCATVALFGSASWIFTFVQDYPNLPENTEDKYETHVQWLMTFCLAFIPTLYAMLIVRLI